MNFRAILIAGPTASGKSGLAVAIAKQLNGVVINADSMQIYDQLSIATARPGLDEQEGIEHLLFGHVDPKENYSVAKWLEDAGEALAYCNSKKKMPIITGGTGLYFKALLEGLAEIPHCDQGVQDRVRRQAQENLAKLYAKLKAVDSLTADRLSENDAQRIARAYEVFESTGKPLSWWQDNAKSKPLLIEEECCKTILEPARNQLHERIENRFHLMLASGLEDEVRRFASMGLDPDLPSMRAIGVRQMLDYFAGRETLDEAIERSIAASRQLAKRQSTWFRHQMSQDWARYQDIDEAREALLRLC